MTVELPQKSEVVPQNPNLEQQTFSGQAVVVDHWEPQPGSQSDLRSQSDIQFSGPQESGPRPHEPNFVQHPIAHGWVGLQVNWAETRDERKIAKTSSIFMVNRLV